MSQDDPERKSKDLKTLREDLESEVPAVAEARQAREAAAAFAKEVRQQLQNARGDLPQAEVARRMGLRHQSRVSRIEKNEGDLTLEALYRYARAIGCTPRLTLVEDGADQGEAQDAYNIPAQIETKFNEIQESIDTLKALWLNSTTVPKSLQRAPWTERLVPEGLEKPFIPVEAASKVNYSWKRAYKKSGKIEGDFGKNWVEVLNDVVIVKPNEGDKTVSDMTHGQNKGRVSSRPTGSGTS